MQQEWYWTHHYEFNFSREFKMKIFYHLTSFHKTANQTFFKWLHTVLVCIILSCDHTSGESVYSLWCQRRGRVYTLKNTKGTTCNGSFALASLCLHGIFRCGSKRFEILRTLLTLLTTHRQIRLCHVFSHNCLIYKFISCR